MHCGRCAPLMFSFFFFFQAEDGIRDTSVTGVQTCALPISAAPRGVRHAQARRRWAQAWRTPLGAAVQPRQPQAAARETWRSEERRVGKECRTRWSPYQQKKRETKERAVEGRGGMRRPSEES